MLTPFTTASPLLQHVVLGLFVLSAVAYLVLMVVGTSHPWYPSQMTLAFLKCLPIWLLIGLVWVHSAPVPLAKSRYSKLIAVGLVFSSMGDFALAMEGTGYLAHIDFLLGLIFFLIAHLFYVAAFGFSKERLHLVRLAPLLLFGVGLYFYVFLPKLLPLKLEYPVAVYMTVIITMVWRAAARLEYAPKHSNPRIDKYIPSYLWFALGGAVFFFVSDLMLAMNKFVVPFAGARFLTMLTYYIAQFGIAASVHLVDIKKDSNNRKST